MTDKQLGGVDWELSEAIRLMGEAVASGDKDAIATAMRRHAEALSNQAIEKMVKPFEKAVGQLLDKKIGTLSDRIDRSDQARLNRNAHFQNELDTRLDTHGAALDRIEQGLVIRRQAIDERLDNHEGRIARIEKHLGLASDGK